MKIIRFSFSFLNKTRFSKSFFQKVHLEKGGRLMFGSIRYIAITLAAECPSLLATEKLHS